MAKRNTLDWIEIKAACDYLGRSKRSVDGLIAKENFTYALDGKKKYLKIAEINRYIESKILIKQIA